MPALSWNRRRWQIASDFLPVIACLGLAYHAVWFIIVGALLISAKPHSCSADTSARLLRAVLDGTLIFMGMSTLMEIPIVFIGLRGTPFEESKRKHMGTALWSRFTLWVLQFLFNCYSTVVIATVSVSPCWQTDNGKAIQYIHVMVYMVWGFIVWNWFRVAVFYNLFPDFQDVNSWQRRGRVLLFGLFKNRDSREIKEQLKKQGERPIKRMTQIFASMLSDIDLAPSDQVVGLVLLAALQRRRRGIHIRSMLLPNGAPLGLTLAELRALRNTSMDGNRDQLQAHLERAATLEAGLDGPPGVQKLGRGRLRSAEHGFEESGSDQKFVAVERLESASSASLGQDAPELEPSVQEIDHQIANSNLDTFLTPSSIAAELRPDLEPAEAADIYTGHHQQVSKDVLRDAAVFAKYACGVYGSSFYLWLQSRKFRGPFAKYRTFAQLLARRGPRAFKQNELNADKITSLTQILDYEAVIHYTGLKDNDLLYFSYTNQALGVLPYIVALDHDTKSVVVAIRGSVSSADWVTDMLGIPEPLGDWLPNSFRAENPDIGVPHAHAGILAAAKALWTDLEEHGILAVLLGSDEDSEGDASSDSAVGGGDEQLQEPSASQSFKTGHPQVECELAEVRVDKGGCEEGESKMLGESVASPDEAGEGGTHVRDQAPPPVMRGVARGKYAAEVMKRGLHKDGWKLVLTGHSLGGGAAALLALRLKDKFPGVKCWSFCPPGGLVSAGLGEAMKPFCSSVIMSKDAISRLSVPNLSALIDEMLIALARCKQPTLKVLLNTSFRSKRVETIDKLLYAPEETKPECLERLHGYQQRQGAELHKASRDMYPPGACIFMRRLKNKIVAKARKRAEHEAEHAARSEALVAAKRRKQQAKHLERTHSLAGTASAQLPEIDHALGRGSLRTTSASEQSIGASRPSIAPVRVQDAAPSALDGEESAKAPAAVRYSAAGEALWQSEGAFEAADAKVGARLAEGDSANGTAPGLGPDSYAAHLLPPGAMPELHTLSPFAVHVPGSPESEMSLEAGASSSALGGPAAGVLTGSRGSACEAGSQVALKSGTPQLRSPSAGSVHRTQRAASVRQDRTMGMPVVGSTAEAPAAISAGGLSSDEEAEEEVGAVYERLWDAVWIRAQDIIAEGILVSPRMTSDHYTSTLVGALQAALSGGRETGTDEQLLANEDPAEAFNTVVQLETILKASGPTGASTGEASTGGGEDRKGAGFVRQAVADLLPG